MFVGFQIGDLNIVLVNWNLNVTPGDAASGDFDGEGLVGIGDLNGVLGNGNAGTPPGAPLAEASGSIPEPGTLGALGRLIVLRFIVLRGRRSGVSAV